MPLAKCPTCGARFDPAASQTMPFCSDRCRLIDLGRWLDEHHSLPAEKSPDDDESPDEAPSAPEDENE